MEQQKEYYAFISYKREDVKWAKWLQDKLEHYKFPTNLNGRTDLPKHIRPTFRDVTSSTPGFLEQVIDDALRNSEWLIVICSPRSAKSPWVCKEAQAFIDQGRADHIIPFVIEGKPFSRHSSTECYPEALLNLTGSKELLAANIKEGGQDLAAVRVVARMFGLGVETLWQRFEREQKRKRWMWIGGSMLLAILGLGIGAYFISQNRIIEKQKTRLQNDSIILSSHLEKIRKDSLLLSIQNDSITLQNRLIQSQRDSLGLSTKRLKISNIHLIEESNKVLRANWKIQENISRRITNEINKAINVGNLYLAQRLTKEILPSNIDSPNKPFLHETEDAIRAINSIFEDSGYKSVAILGKGDYSFFMEEDKLVTNDINHSTAFVFYKDNVGKTPLSVPLVQDKEKDNCCIWNLNEGTSKKMDRAFWAWNNGHSLAAVSNNEYKLFVLDSLGPRDYIELPVSFSQQHLDICKHHTLSRNGKYVAYEIGDSIFIFNLHDKKQETSINARQPIGNILISPLENRILFIADSILYEYDLTSHKKTLALPSYMAADYNTDGSMIYAAKKKDTIDIISCNREKIENQLHIAYDNCSKIVLSPNGHLLAIICGKEIILWNLSKSLMTQAIEGYGEIKDFSFSPKINYFVTTDNNRDVRLWSNESINPWGFNLLKAGKDYYFDNIWISPLKDYFVLNTVPITQTSDSLELIIFDLKEISVRKRIKLPSVTLPQIGKIDYRYSLCKNLFAVAITSQESSLIIIVDLDKEETVKLIKYPNSVHSISFSPEGKELVIEGIKRAYYSTSSWNLECIDSIYGGNIAIRENADEQNYLTCQSRNIAIKKNLRALEDIIKRDPYISHFGFSNDQNLFATQKLASNIIKVYNLSTGESKEYNGVKGSGNMWFNDENTQIYIETFKGLYVLDLESGITSVLSSVGKSFVMGFDYYLYNDRDVVSVRTIPTVKDIISSWNKKMSNYPLTKEEKQIYYLE